MDVTITAQLIVFGLLIGSVYGLVALGLTMIWGVMDVVNIAHGVLMVVGMYTVWYVSAQLGFPPLVAAPLAVGLLFVVGLVIYRTTLAPVLDAPDSHHLIVTLGWLLIISSVIQIVFSPEPRSLDLGSGSVAVLGVFIPHGRLVGLAIAVCAVLGMVVLLYRTHLGRAIRATADNRRSAKYAGIDVQWVDHVTFGIGAALAGLAGTVIPLIQRFDPFLGDFYLTTAFVVAVLGGLGSFFGALVGGLIVGMIHVFGQFYLPGSSNRIVVFLVFIAVLLFRPNGLFGGANRD